MELELVFWMEEAGQDRLLVRTLIQETQSGTSRCELSLLVSEIECDSVLRDGVDPREAKPDKLNYLVDMAR